MSRLFLVEYQTKIVGNAHLKDFPPNGLCLEGQTLRVGRSTVRDDVTIITGHHNQFFELRITAGGWCLWTTAVNPVLLNNTPVATGKEHPLRDGDSIGTAGTIFQYRDS